MAGGAMVRLLAGLATLEGGGGAGRPPGCAAAGDASRPNVMAAGRPAGHDAGLRIMRMVRPCAGTGAGHWWSSGKRRSLVVRGEDEVLLLLVAALRVEVAAGR